MPLGMHTRVCLHRHTRTHTFSPLLGISVRSCSLRARLSLAACPLGTGRLRGLGEQRVFPKMHDQMSGPDVEGGGHASGAHPNGEGWGQEGRDIGGKEAKLETGP